jgi:hypothetical protein
MTEDAAIRIDLHSAEIAHFTHTMELRASGSHSGGPVLLQQNLSIAWHSYGSTNNHTLPGSCPGWPLCHPVTPATVVAKQNCPKRGRAHITINWAHRIIAAYRARVARTHNPPCLVVPVKEHEVRPSQGRPIPANVAARVSPGRWLLINQLSLVLSLLSHILYQSNNNDNPRCTLIYQHNNLSP